MDQSYFSSLRLSILTEMKKDKIAEKNPYIRAIKTFSVGIYRFPSAVTGGLV